MKKYPSKFIPLRYTTADESAVWEKIAKFLQKFFLHLTNVHKNVVLVKISKSCSRHLPPFLFIYRTWECHFANKIRKFSKKLFFSSFSHKSDLKNIQSCIFSYPIYIPKVRMPFCKQNAKFFSKNTYFYQPPHKVAHEKGKSWRFFQKKLYKIYFFSKNKKSAPEGTEKYWVIPSRMLGILMHNIENRCKINYYHLLFIICARCINVIS